MRLIVVTEEGDNYSLDVDAEMEIENLSALLEAESGVSTEAQILYFGQNELRSPQATLKSVGVKQDDMILMRRNDRATASTSIAQPPASSSQAPSSSAYASNPSNSLPFEQSEMMRLQLLGDPQLLARLRSTHPEMASAAESHPQRFHQLLPQLANMRQQSMMEQQRNQELLESDPFDIEAQRRIEEAIREEAVYENLEHAMEYSPESFGRVEMLYVNVEVNGRPVKAFVDSGAQATIMSPDCAEACGILRLIDKRFAGIATGVGTAKILGRVHSAQIRVGRDLFLPCSFTIMEGRGVDLLFGLDMLKRHQACIDLAQDALIIQGRRIPFLSEHEAPKQHFDSLEADEHGNVQIPKDHPLQSNPKAALGAAAAASAEATATSFPGTGNTLTPGAPASSSEPAAPGPASSHSSQAIDSLMALGVSRQEAIRLLDASGGNPDVAASLMFS